MNQLLCMFIILVLLPSTYSRKIIDVHKCQRTSDNNYCVFELDGKTISEIITTRPKLSESLKRICIPKLPPNYVFLDYSYEIINSRLYTFHRDLTSSQSYQNLRHPSYTLIIYLYNGEFLNICPDSLKKMTVGKPVTIKGKTGTAILFNADMAHAASTYYAPRRHCIQYKLCHSDDMRRLNHLNKQHIVNKNDISKKIILSERYLSRLSHKYLLLNDIRFIGDLSERTNNSIIIKIIRKIFKLDFYNDT